MKRKLMLLLGLLGLGLSSCTGGAPSRYVVGIERTDGDGTVDVYTITYNDGSTDAITVTNGVDGEQGEKGEDGHTPTITIGENGNWFIDGSDTGVPAKGETGPQGEAGPQGEQGPQGETGAQGPQGEAGESAATPYIGANGNWWVGETDTGVQAQGPKGEDGAQGPQGQSGVSPRIGDDGYWWIGGIFTGIPARGPVGETGPQGPQGPEGAQGPTGEPGDTPYIGANGNWWVGETDTGVQAQGPQGEKGDIGETPSVEIGENGNWWIEGTDTGISAYGSAGTYTVTLDPREGTMPAGSFGSYVVKYGATIANLPSPELAYYDFIGWYTGDEVSDGLFTSTTPVTEDLNLVARYRYIYDGTESYKITWLDYDMTVLEVDEHVIAGEMPTYDGEMPSREAETGYSYVFVGWTPEVILASEDAFYVATYEKRPDVVTISLDIGEYGNIGSESVELPYGESLQEVIIDTSAVPPDIGFAGWYLEPEFVNKVEFPFAATEDTTLYARWVGATDQLTYYFDEANDGYVCRSYNDKAECDTVLVPSEYNDGIHGTKPVIGMGMTFAAVKGVNKVILPEGFKFIGDNAFLRSGIKEVEFPSTLESIGSYAFCQSEIETPDLSDTKVTEIPAYCFNNCPYVRSIALPSGLMAIGDSAFSYCTILSKVDIPDGTKTLGNNAFSSCWITDVSIPDSVEEIGVSCFSFCSYLTHIELPPLLTHIAESTFWQCRSLQEISLPEGIVNIDVDAFGGCSGLKQIIIPKSISNISVNAFNGCTSLTIYSLFAAQPSHWSENWNSFCPVYWYSEENPGSTPGSFWHYDEEGLPTKW